MSTTVDSPPIGTRISHSGFLGTVRFVGHVDGTRGIWLGVEWDDPDRGKHDGIKDGKRYFSCLAPNSGSFIRQSPAIAYGVSFLSALSAKYVEIPHGTASLEKVTLGSSGGVIEVEAVGLDKIRNKLARLERLRQVSLDNELVSRADQPGEIGETCPGIRGLDLSKNLISTWDTIAKIAVELPNLRSLSLNQNRFQPLEHQFTPTSPFKLVEDLQLSATLITWTEFQALLPSLPSLKSVELGYNRLQSTPANPNIPHTSLEHVNFDGNELDSFADLQCGMANLIALQRLVLTSNRLSQIHVPPEHNAAEAEAAVPLRALKHLALAFNRISSWRDVDTLRRWAPQLESLTLAGNPVISDPAHASYARAFTIAKLPSLMTLDGATISPRERTDSELLYLSHISKEGFASDSEKRDAHPQWERLTAKHGVSAAPAPPEAQDTLSSRLIGIQVHHAAAPPPAALGPEASAALPAPAAVRVLSSMPVRALRLKLAKACKVPKARAAAARVWLVLPGGQCVELGEEHAGRDLAYWGVEEGTRFVLVDGGR